MSDERASAIARVVADHWRAAAMEWGNTQMEGRLTAHPLCLVMDALDGETDPALLGVEEGPDAETIRRVASGDAQTLRILKQLWGW